MHRQLLLLLASAKCHSSVKALTSSLQQGEFVQRMHKPQGRQNEMQRESESTVLHVVLMVDQQLRQVGLEESEKSGPYAGDVGWK